MKPFLIGTIALLLLMGPATAAAPSGRLIAVIAVAGLSGGVTFPPGWHTLFDLEDDSTKQISCSAAWRENDSDALPLKVQTGSPVEPHKGKYVVMQVTDYDRASPPEATAAINGVTSRPQPPALSVSWGVDDNLFFVAFCGSRSGPIVTSTVKRTGILAVGAFPSLKSGPQGLITATIGVRGIGGHPPRFTMVNPE